MTCKSIVSTFHSFLNVAAKISVRPSEGMAEGGCGGNSAMPERIELSPRHLPEYLESRTPKKNVLSFLVEIGRAQIRKARNIFLWCPPRLCEAVAGLIHSFSFRSKKVRAKCIITAPVVTCSELRIWSDFAEAKIVL